MIQTRSLLQTLCARGDAREEGMTKPEDISRKQYVIVTRYDLQRVDHYVATAEDVERLSGVEITD